MKIGSGIRPTAYVLAAAAIALAVAMVGFARDQLHEHDEAIARAEQSLDRTAGLLAEHTARSFEAAAQALHAVERLWRASNGQTGAETHELLKTVHGGTPVLRAVGWADVRGNRVASSLYAAPPPLNIADQEQFRVFADDADGSDQLHVSPPVRSQLLGEWIVSVSIPLRDPGRRFAGIAAGMVAPQYFARVYEAAALGPSMVVNLLRHDGTLLARAPFDEAVLDAPENRWSAVARRAAERGRGCHRAPGMVDGIDRIACFAQVPGGRFVVTVSLARQEVLADFWHDFRRASVGLALVVASILVVTGLLSRYMHDRARHEADLKASETRFRDFAMSSADWFWETDEAHRFIWLSDSVERVAGIPAARFLGKRRLDIAARDPAAAHREHAATLDSHVPFRNFEYRVNGRMGERVMRTSGVPVFDASGNFRGYRGAGSDVTALRQAEQRLQDAIAAIPASFLYFDRDDRLTYMSADNERHVPETALIGELGDTFESLLRNTVAAGLIPEAQADPEGWVARRLARHREAVGSTLVRFRDRVVEAVERRTADGGTILLRFDVSERELAREAEQSARLAADRANRAKSEFLAHMSHELRTPLNSILGFAQLLQLDLTGNLTDRQKEYAGHVVASGQHLLALVNEVLDLAGIETGKTQVESTRVELDGLVSQAVAAMQPLAAKAGVSLAGPAMPSGLAVRGDSQRLRQVVLNLLSNAIKYNRPGGSVSLAMAPTSGHRCRISVTDTGIGIPPARRDEVFIPFNRLGASHTSVEGTGIGLALCRNLVESMHGEIDFTSTPGQGSTFWIELPSDAGDGAPADDRQPPPAGGTLSNCTLLYIEDDPTSRTLMQHLVERMPGVTLQSAPTGRQGLQLASAERPDVIILDNGLPDVTGREILARLRQSPVTQDIPVIALSGSPPAGNGPRGREAGYFRYLTKPLARDVFLASLAAALASRPQQA